MGGLFSKLKKSGANVWFAVNSLLAGISVPLYLLNVDGAIKNFGGSPTATSRFWAQTVASGDALCVAMCMNGFLTKSGKVKSDTAKLVGLYNFCHMSTFLYAHMNHEPHPGGATPYIASLVIGSSLAAYYGFIAPPEDEKAD